MIDVDTEPASVVARTELFTYLEALCNYIDVVLSYIAIAI